MRVSSPSSDDAPAAVYANPLFWFASAAGAIVAATLLVACGPGEGAPCGGGCKYGVCDEARDKCVNADSCEPPQVLPTADAGTDAGTMASGADAGTSKSPPPSDCLHGYSCVDGACQPDETCSTDGDPCTRGTCVDGRCVNKEKCVEKKGCRPGFRCYDGKCEYAPCSDKNCERGVCRAGKCVNADSCPSGEDEPPACLEDHTCHQGTCHEKEGFCDRIDCERGVCDSEKAACVDAENCQKDAQCLKGMYCNDEGNCAENKCYEVKRICDRGVCDPADRSCGNPDSCSERDDCAPTYSCIDKKCVPTDEMCGEEGCPGNQVCKYNEKKLSAKCIENPNEPCRNAIDCKDKRVCSDGSCGDPTACMNDGAEPNNSANKATSYFKNRKGEFVGGTICSGDSDFFAFDTSKDDDFRGRFTVSLEYNSTDVGIADLKIRVLKPDGSKWFEERVDGSKGEAVVDKRFGAGAPRGTYHVVVEDPGSVRKPGVRYQMLIDIVAQGTVNACKQSMKLNTPTQQGDTTTGASVGIDASCIKQGDQSPENIYEFELDKQSFVRVRAKPDGADDLSVAIRSTCELPTSEKACANEGRVGATEQLETTLEPGKYYLIVQGTSSDSDGGQYELDFQRSDANCTDADNRCVDSSTAEICSPKGNQLQEVQCDLGCNTARNRCTRAKGDVCYKAVDASGGVSGHTIDWGKLRNDFEAAGSACLPRNPDADGPDKVFEVDIPTGHVLLADLQAGGSQDSSLYVLSTCQDASTFCEAGRDGNGNTESLRYPNRSGSAEHVFLIADSAAGTGGSSTIDIKVEKLICTPGDRTCNGDDVEECNNDGTGRNKIKTCGFGCTGGACEADQCGQAFDVSGGGSWTFDPQNYRDDYAVGGFGSSCISATRQGLDGPDAVFQADVPAGKVLEAKVTEPVGSTLDAATYLVTDCSSAQTHEQTCSSGSYTPGSGTETSTVRNGESTSQTFYIVVDSADASGTTPSDWTLDVNVKNPICTPLDTKCGSSSSTLKYCSRTGLKYKSYNCSGSPATCTTSSGRAKCSDPTGEHCYDPFELSSGSSSKTIDMRTMGNSVTAPRSCTGRDTAGNDVVYRVDAKAGEYIQASAKEAPGAFSQDPAIYILEGNCLDAANSCVAGSDGLRQSSESLTYKIPSGAGGTYYVVFDATDTFESDEKWEIDVSVGSPICTPGNVIGCKNQDDLEYCSRLGLQKKTFTCQGGTSPKCKNSRCKSPSGDICQDYIDAGTGGTFTADFGSTTPSLGNDYDMQDRSCVSGSTAGDDAVYRVSANAGQTVKVTATPRTFSDDAAVYIGKSCHDIATNSAACVAGSNTAFGTSPESASYTVPAGGGGKYWIFVDGPNTFDTRGRFDVNITVN